MAKNRSAFTPHADDPKVRVRKSYYTFAKEYPAGNIAFSSKRRKPKRGKTILRVAALAVAFFLLVGVAFFVTDLGLRISNQPVSETQEALTPDAAVDFSAFKAQRISPAALESRRTLKKQIDALKRRDCTAVVVDFKTSDGKLLYTSAQSLALQAQSSIYDNETVRSAVKQLRRAGFYVFAGVYCFDDPRVAALDASLTAKYLDTEVPWLTAREEDGGRAWLNPYATPVRAFLKGALQEIAAFGVNGVVLQAYAFPDGQAPENASFPGEENNVSRNRLLKNLLHSIRELLPETCSLLVELDVDALQNGSETLYGGDLFPCEADGAVCKLSGSIAFSKKDKYLSGIAALQMLQGEAEGVFLPELSKAEATPALVKALRRNGLGAVVIEA